MTGKPVSHRRRPGPRDRPDAASPTSLKCGAILNQMNLNGQPVQSIVQGFGNVGAVDRTCASAYKSGMKIVGISDQHGDLPQ